MISTFTVFFDANVFYGARLRSLVLFLAQTKLFRARWSDAVHEEWIENLLRKRPDLRRENLLKTRQLMDQAVPDCLVSGYEPLVAGLNLPDPGDRHVLAAAILTRAHAIVTFNGADFPADYLSGFRLSSKHPDDFLPDTLSLEPAIFAEAVLKDFEHYQRPALSFESYISALAAAGVPKTSALLREWEILSND
jgi:hypothetical protein